MQQGLSVVVPFLNEADGIETFCIEFDKICKELDFNVEVIFVDDGSDDNTSELIKRYKFESIKHVKIITFTKNYGSHAAIRAGISNAMYDMCTWVCSDLQEPLEFLKLGYQKIIEGYDAVYIEKNTIKVSKVNRLISKMYSWLMRKYAVKNFASGGVNNIVFNKKIKDYLNNNVEANSAINLQIMSYGGKNITFSLDYKERKVGKSKWSFAKKMKLFIDSFVAFSFMPIRLVSIVGIIMFLLGTIFGLGVIINKICNPNLVISGYSTLACLISIGFGITNISLGIIAEYLWRAYDAARNRPAFIVSTIDCIGKEDK